VTEDVECEDDPTADTLAAQGKALMKSTYQDAFQDPTASTAKGLRAAGLPSSLVCSSNFRGRRVKKS
jgi:hypothetical protein